MKTRKYRRILSLTGAALLLSTPLIPGTLAANGRPTVAQAATSQLASAVEQSKSDRLLNDLLAEQAALAGAQATMGADESEARQVSNEQNETAEILTQAGQASDSQATAEAAGDPTGSSTSAATADVLATPASAASEDINKWMPNRRLQQIVLNNLQRQGVAVTSVDQIHEQEMLKLKWLSNEPMTDPGNFAPFDSELVPQNDPDGDYLLDGLNKATNLKSVVLKGLGRPQRRGNIRSLTPLAQMVYLETIDVSGNQLRYTSPLIRIQNESAKLKSVDISNNSIGNFSGLKKEKLQQFKYKGQMVVTNNTGVPKGETTETYDLTRVIKPLSGETLESQFGAPRLNFKQYQRFNLALPVGQPQNKISVYENGAAQGNGSVSGFKITYEGLAEQEYYPGLPTEFAGQTDLSHKYRYAMFVNLYQRGETDQPVVTVIIPYHDTDLVGVPVFVQGMDENGEKIGAGRFAPEPHPRWNQQGNYTYHSYSGYVDQKERLPYRITDEPQSVTVVYQPMLRAQDREIARGSAWIAKDNLTQVRTKKGTEVPLETLDLDKKKIKVTITADNTGNEVTEAEATAKIGKYTIVYQYDYHKFTSHLTVTGLETTIIAHDLTIKANEAWSPADHFVGAVGAEGIALALTDLNVDASSVDPNKPGVYQVIFTIPAALNGGKSYRRIVELTVEANDLEAPPVDPETPTPEQPEKPTPEQPEKPTPEEPEKPTPEEPETPTPEEPEKPTPEEPEKPTPEEPEKPTPEEPEKPTPEQPEKPTPEEPEKPTPEQPEKPTPEEPEKPTPEQPEKPTPEEPEKPTPEQPEKPTPEEPEKPTPEQPEKPTPEQPEKPTPEEPEKPTPEKPEKPTPEEPEKPTPEEPEAPTPEQPEKPTPEEPEKPTPEEPEKPTPEEPEKPTPEEPEKPTPEQPEKPTPEEPETPTPEKPEKPTPEEPEKPTPEQPEKPTPEEPEKPTPEKPGKPTPEEPETPTPEKPEKPTPEEPEKPTPEEPETPDLPGEPGESETPVNPENPGDSEAPEQPEKPADPETVPAPVLPSEPQGPQDPQKPAAPDLVATTPQSNLPSTPGTARANGQQTTILPQANERHASILTALGTLALLLTGFVAVRGLWKIVKPR
ncbi:bacterial Ig-like domain-containing protein [Lapidilactobacillus luobeiensis]|uniref:bacterial Ig-like domain-containing protein n=1 Tax=Lapidilactobacillus luobeiensis TaxID=2950371 RepID=UPI0021C47B1F|nr:bacterial Ig-like domain-containing protein [Lapidilactobacillus luobeiensis]